MKLQTKIGHHDLPVVNLQFRRARASDAEPCISRWAIIDTASERSYLRPNKKEIEDLRLTMRDKIDFTTGTGEGKTVQADAFSLWAKPAGGKSPTLIFPRIVIGIHKPLHYEALIGLDVLSMFTFSYEGPKKLVTIDFAGD